MNRIEVIENLCNAFPELGLNNQEQLTLRHYEEKAEDAGSLTIGCEIEVRWRHYFPELWEKYNMENVPYSRMDRQQQYDLSYDCDVLERELIPRLALTEAAGIPKGRDKYYEFAHSPVYHPYTLSIEVGLLKKLGLIPKGIKHSLQITIGGLGHSRDTGLMLMALELLGYTSPERILSAADSDKALAWGRKGRAGLRERDGTLLSLGAEKAIELRTLELPVTDREIGELFARTSLMANAINGVNEKQFMKWLNIVDELEQLGHWHNIDVWSNWGPPYQNPEIWKDFASKLPLIDNTRLKELVDEL